MVVRGWKRYVELDFSWGEGGDGILDIRVPLYDIKPEQIRLLFLTLGLVPGISDLRTT